MSLFKFLYQTFSCPSQTKKQFEKVFEFLPQQICAMFLCQSKQMCSMNASLIFSFIASLLVQVSPPLTLHSKKIYMQTISCYFVRKIFCILQYCVHNIVWIEYGSSGGERERWYDLLGKIFCIPEWRETPLIRFKDKHN